MTETQYNRKIIWASFWLNVWGVYDFLKLPHNLNGIFGWIVSQTGFLYAHPYSDDVEFWEAE